MEFGSVELELGAEFASVVPMQQSESLRPSSFAIDEEVLKFLLEVAHHNWLPNLTWPPILFCAS